MWIRLLVLGAGMVMMITGCNSLISQFFGTHRLRAMPIEAAQTEGLGDADFVRLEAAVLHEEYLRGAPLHSTDKPIVIYPLLSEEQLAAHQAGEQVELRYLGWSTVFDLNCYDRGDCYSVGPGVAQGLVRPPNPRKTPTADDWSAYNFQLSPEANYLQIGREPMAWYWNLLLFLLGIGIPVLLEARAFRQQRKDS